MGLKLGNTDIADVKLGATQIASVYLGGNLIWTGGALTEAEKVIARMSLPSQAFQDAITILVEAEQAALGDNWQKIDDLQVFMVDTSTNSLISWKGIANPTIHSGAPTFTAYDGYLLKSSTLDAINTNLDNTKFSNYTLNSAFVGVNFVSATSGVIQKIMSSLNSALGFTIAAGGSFESNVNTTTPLLTAHGGEYDGYYVGHVVENTKYNLLEDGEIIDTTATARNILPTNINIGMAADSQYFDGKNRFNVWGGGAGFDTVAHSVNVKNFTDAMLIEKHRTVVDTVLNRYTNLSSIETWTISRLVARSVEDGNFGLLYEVFLLGLFDEANAVIGFKDYEATNEGADFVAGKGFYGDGVAKYLSTNFLPDSTGVLPIAGCITKEIQNIGTYNYNFFGSGYSGIQLASFGIRTTFALRSAGVQFPNNIALIGENSNYTISRQDSTSIKAYSDGVEVGTMSSNFSGTVYPSIYILARNDEPLAGLFLDGGVGSVYIAENTGFNIVSWNTNLWQAANELEIEKANDSNDWDVQDKVYDWSNREIAPDQLEKLVGIIDLNSDGTTTGRSLDITANLGITLNAQLSLDSLVAKGFVII